MHTKLVRGYVWLALIFGIIGLIDGVATLFGFSGFIYDILISTLSFVFFIFNIFVLAVFIQNSLDTIWMVLPIYHVFSYIILFALGVFLSIKEMLSGNVLVLLSVIGMVTSAFEVLFSLYLLDRKEFPQ